MKRYFIFTAKKLGVKRHSKDAVESQKRDIGLFVEHFLNNEFEEFGRLEAENYLSEFAGIDEAIAQILEHKTKVLVAYLSCIGANADEIANTIDKLEGQILVAELPFATSDELKVYAKLEDLKKQFISVRSKAGIELAKAEGKKIGGLRDKTRELNERRKQEADAQAETLKSYLSMFIQRGYTLKQGADLLNERGIKTAQGKEFKPMTVKRYLDRFKG